MMATAESLLVKNLGIGAGFLVKSRPRCILSFRSAA
ncbi:hypothetical protein J2X76_000305 [Neorhizobium sp. 2083]|nr:hypothetical protein [Neorhizobium sp. 2083]